MGNVFDKIVVRMTELDDGGIAGYELSITEARQALSNLLPILFEELTIHEYTELYKLFIETSE